MRFLRALARLARVLLACGILRLSRLLMTVGAEIIDGTERDVHDTRASKVLPSWQHPKGYVSRIYLRTAEWILLSSIAGMFICGLWIALTWRVWK